MADLRDVLITVGDKDSGLVYFNTEVKKLNLDPDLAAGLASTQVQIAEAKMFDKDKKKELIKASQDALKENVKYHAIAANMDIFVAAFTDDDECSEGFTSVEQELFALCDGLAKILAADRKSFANIKNDGGMYILTNANNRDIKKVVTRALNDLKKEKGFFGLFD